ncbi:MAG TPA: sigma-70 family RNA polymerase sigma factor [Polyangiaceae bacterium]
MPATSKSTLSSYISKANEFPRLSRAEELELWHKWRDEKDDDARDVLVRAHLRYVVAIAWKYRCYSMPQLELIAEGNLGILHALNRFEPGRGNRFVTYAAYWIRAFILNYIIRSWSMVGAGSGPLHSRVFFRLRRERSRIASLVGEGELANSMLAERVGYSIEQIAEFSQRLSARDVSLDRDVFGDGTTSLVDTLASPDCSQEQAYFRYQHQKRVIQVVRMALKSLDQREKLVVQAYWMSDDDEKLSLAGIGRRLGVSRERVRQLECRAKKKLKRRILEMAGPLSAEAESLELARERMSA